MAAYTALQLITRAYYLSQIVSRQLQTPSGEQITDGLYLLNALLDYKSTDIRLIPYFQEYFFNTVQGTEQYFIPGLLYPDSLTFNIGDVRYSLIETTRKEYWSGPRVDDIQSLPYEYRFERCLNGTNLFLYFVPEAIYQMKLWGKFSLPDVTLETDLSLIFDSFYIEYYRYALAQEICEEWGTTFPDESKMKLSAMEKKLMEVSPPDLSIQKRNYFGSIAVWDWQTINLYKGFLPN
jgi:hypothetical protein